MKDGFEVVDYQGEKYPMKKIMSVMLGLSLVLGAASVVFAQDKTTDTSKSKTTKTKKTKKTTGTTTKTS